MGQSIPNMIPHSGTVTVNGTPFNGTGQFKFAIIDAEEQLRRSLGGPTISPAQRV